MSDTTQVIDGETVADIDVSALTREQLHNYRLELTQILWNRAEVFLDPHNTDKLREFYLEKIRQCKAALGTD
jgi:hypothetical protein